MQFEKQHPSSVHSSNEGRIVFDNLCADRLLSFPSGHRDTLRFVCLKEEKERERKRKKEKKKERERKRKKKRKKRKKEKERERKRKKEKERERKRKRKKRKRKKEKERERKRKRERKRNVKYLLLHRLLTQNVHHIICYQVQCVFQNLT